VRDPKRVLRVITRLNIGGPARQALSLTKDLAPEFDTTLVAGRSQEGEGELSDPDVPVKRISLVRPLSPREDLRAYRDLRHVVGAPFDLIHTHMAKAGALTRRAGFKASHRPALVHTFHGHVLDGYFSRPVREAFVRIERHLAKHTDALVAVSDHVRDELLALGIGRPEQWQVIPLGFDLSALIALQSQSGIVRERLGLDRSVPLVGVLGRLATIKDHETLIRGVARLDGVHLAVLGDGEMKERMLGLVGELGIGNRVHLLGWLTDVAGAISDMDVVALTSRNEGTPVSLIEASAGAKPVVSTDVGGVRAVVSDGTTGLLVPPGDSEAVAAALEKLLHDSDLRTRMGAAGREHVRDRFDKARLISDIKNLYRDLLNRRVA
jgi:glycosyltransferase involved in cell wall biosynthesis